MKTLASTILNFLAITGCYFLCLLISVIIIKMLEAGGSSRDDILGAAVHLLSLITTAVIVGSCAYVTKGGNKS